MIGNVSHGRAALAVCVLALLPVAGASAGNVAGAKPSTLSVRALRSMCSKGEVRRRTVTVHGYYVVLPVDAPGRLGALFGHPIAPAAAFHSPSTPPGGRLTIKIAPGAIVVLGRGDLGQATPIPALPGNTWVAVQGTVHCRGLALEDPTFAGAKRQPWMVETSWQLPQNHHVESNGVA